MIILNIHWQLLQLLLTQMIYNSSPNGISQNVNGRPEPVEQPVDSQDECDVVGWETHCVQDHDHGDQSCLRDAGRADGGGSGCDADG